MDKMCYAIILTILILDVALQYLIASRTHDVQALRPLLYTQALLPSILFVIITSLRFNSIRWKLNLWIRGYFSVFIFFVLTHLLLSTLIGLIAFQSPVEPFMDLIRALSPFLVFFSLIFSTNTTEVTKPINQLMSIIFIYVYFLSGAKILLLMGGTYYGGGAHQFAIPVFVLSILIYLIVSPLRGADIMPPYVPRRAFGKILLLSLIITLSVLSLKREQWFLTAFATIFTLLMTLKSRRSIPMVIFIIISCWVAMIALENYGTLDILLNRANYTFSGSRNSQLDNSSFERIAEIQGIIYSLGNDVGLVEYLFGHGNGAEYRGNPDYPSAKISTGSDVGLYRHAHSMYFIILIRNGALGVVLYLMPIIVFIWRSLTYGKKFGSRIEGLNIAMLVGSFGFLISGFSANSAYGSITYGFFIYITLLMAKENKVG